MTRSPQSRRVRKRLVVGLAFLMAVIIAVPVIISISDMGTEVTGTVRSEGGRLGTWTMTPDGCHSGSQSGVFGVDLTTSADRRLLVKVMHDAGGQLVVTVKLPDSDGRGLVLSRKSCSRFEGAVRQGTSRTGGVKHVFGRAIFDCEVGGGRVQGELQFAECH